MSESRDPARLLEVPDTALAELDPLLRAARTQGPSMEQGARMRAALGLPAAGDPAAADDAATHADAAARAGKTRAEHGARTPTWLKLSLLVALGIGALFLAQRALRSAQPDAGASALPRVGVERSERSAGGVGATVTATAPASASDPRLSPPAVSVSPAKSVRGVVPARTATPARRGRAATAVRATEETSAPLRDVTDPAAELALLKRAKAHAHSAPERALALLAEHEQRFANGAFVQEREVIAIEALLASGDRDAAEQRAARFFERFTDSAHARRVRALLGAPAAALSDTNSGAPPHPSRSWRK